MRFGIIAPEIEPQTLARINTYEWNCGFTPTPIDQFKHIVDIGSPTIYKYITAWKVAGFMYRRDNKQNLFIVNCPEGTAEEYAPAQKPPPKKFKESA